MNIIDEKTDVCNIYKTIKKISGFDADSSSPTDTWIITFKNGTRYKNEEISSGFLKLFVEYSTLPSTTDRMLILKLKGLNYELKLYKDVIRPLIDLNICPNFVKYLASGERCTYTNLLNMLENNLYNAKKIPKSEIPKILNRNINCTIDIKCDTRYSIDRQTFNYLDNVNPPNSKYRYNMILNEQIPPNSDKFSDFMFTYRGSKNFNNAIRTIIFQIAAGCYAMSLSKMVHNDMHSGNIFITKLAKPEVLTYIIDKKEYRFETKYIAYIYDFDRGYCEYLGNNPFLDRKVCLNNSQCNLFINNKDMLKIMCYIIKFTEGYLDKGDILNCLSNDKNYIKLLLEDYDRQCFFTSNYVTRDQKTFFNNFYDMGKIVGKFGSLLHLTVKKSNKIYVCNKEFFNSNGTINMSKFKNQDSSSSSYLSSEQSNFKPKKTPPPKPKATPKRPTRVPKPCRSDQVRNPETGRCVLKRRAAFSYSSKKRKASSHPKRTPPKKTPQKKTPKPCRKDQIRNPKTGRCILKRRAKA